VKGSRGGDKIKKFKCGRERGKGRNKEGVTVITMKLKEKDSSRRGLKWCKVEQERH
jgi:hypothetical protein